MRNLKINSSIVPRESAITQMYISEVAKAELIEAEEEVTLALRSKSGDDGAREKLVLANLRFAFSVAKEYQHNGLPLNDLINAANIGLIEASKRFDSSRGFKFISYAVFWIRQSILKELADHARLVRLPLNKIGKVYALDNQYALLEQCLGQAPTDEELSEFTGAKKDDLHELYLKHQGGSLSLDAPVGSENDGYDLIDTMPGEKTPQVLAKLEYHESLSLVLNKALEPFSERDSTVVRMYFGIGYMLPFTMHEIAKRLGITEEAVWDIKKRVLRNVKKQSGLELAGFLRQ